ncbi:hypothetical protein AAKU67_003977 [Oxalobacteraceae bacterium GrIS 2.11]
MATKWRWILWLSILTVTVIAALYPTSPASKSAGKKLHLNSGTTLATLTNPIAQGLTSATSPAHLPELDHDPFGPVAWDTPPPPPPAPPVVVQTVIAEPPAPVEPNLPYQFQGQMKDEDGTTVIFLSKGQEGIVAHVGDILDTNYKVVSMDEHKLTIAYLPMDKLHDIALDRH